jgi:hypothetical protein
LLEYLKPTALSYTYAKLSTRRSASSVAKGKRKESENAIRGVNNNNSPNSNSSITTYKEDYVVPKANKDLDT